MSRYLMVLAAVIFLVSPAVAAEIPAEMPVDAPPVAEEAAELPAAGEVVDFGTTAPVFQASNRGSCTQACKDQCKAEYDACKAACPPFDFNCLQDCFCDRYFCLKIECSCQQDPPPGYCI